MADINYTTVNVIILLPEQNDVTALCHSSSEKDGRVYQSVKVAAARAAAEPAAAGVGQQPFGQQFFFSYSALTNRHKLYAGGCAQLHIKGTKSY